MASLPKRALGVFVAATSALLGLQARGASAHSPYKRWSVHVGPLSKAGVCGRTANSVGDPVRFWQSVLWAGGHLAKTSISGNFGDTTYAKTKDWQKAHSLTADGCVGQNTLYEAQYSSKHGGHMKFLGSETQCEGTAYCFVIEDWKYQDGQDKSFAMSYDTLCAGGWYWVNPNGNYWAKVYNHNC